MHYSLRNGNCHNNASRILIWVLPRTDPKVPGTLDAVLPRTEVCPRKGTFVM